MLAHSPSLPLILDYLDQRNYISAEDEAGIILALRQRDRIHRVRLRMNVPTLPRVITAFDGEFPILEYLYLAPPTESDVGLVLPETFRAPHLRRFLLADFALSIRSRLLTTATGLVILNLIRIHPSGYFHPGDLLERLSIIAHLEIFRIGFQSPVPNHVVERHLSDTPVMTHVTFPNLRWFTFHGSGAYLEALLRQMTAPSLENLEIGIFNQPPYSIPSLMKFIGTARSLRFPKVTLDFYRNGNSLDMHHITEAKRPRFALHVVCEPPDQQVSSMAQILNTSIPLSFVEVLTLRCQRPNMLSGGHMVSRTLWRELLRPFWNVKGLDVRASLVKDISRSLKPSGGESPTELLLELKQLSYPGGRGGGVAFQAFADARQNVGRPITIVRL
jgi:hypothetical protein